MRSPAERDGPSYVARDADRFVADGTHDSAQPSRDTAQAAHDAAEAAAAALEEALRLVESRGASGAVALESTRLVDACATRLARRQGALSLALGETLLALATPGHQARLNVSSIHDFSREYLGLKSDRSRRLVRIAEAVHTRPLLHEAVLRGTVDLCKADVVLPVARADAEAAWVHLARTESVERLEALVKALGYDVPEAYRSALLAATAEQRSRFEQALEVARFTQRGRSRPLLLEALSQEYIGFYGDQDTYARCEELRAPLAAFRAALVAAPPESKLPKRTERQASGPRESDEAEGPCARHRLGWIHFDLRGGACNDDGRQDAACDGSQGVNAIGTDSAAPFVSVAQPLFESPVAPDAWEAAWRASYVRHALEVDATLAALAAAGGDASPTPSATAPDPQASTAELVARARTLADLLNGRAEQMGRLLFVIHDRQLWRRLGYRSFARYCRDRLLIEPRTARYHIRLEERLRERPLLREALRDGRITFSKAEFLARTVDPEHLEQAVDEAAHATLLDLRRRHEEEERRRLAGEPLPSAMGEEGNATGAAGEDGNCDQEEGNVSKPGKVKLDGPEPIMQLAEDAIETAQIVAWLEEGELITLGEALARVADHFVETWLPALPKLSGKERILWERTGGWCAVPGCTGVWQDSHHIVFRSNGGPDDVWNLHPLCRFHHNQCLHGGHMRLRGRAGDRLVWELMTSLDDVVTFVETGAGASRRVRRVEAAA